MATPKERTAEEQAFISQWTEVYFDEVIIPEHHKFLAKVNREWGEQDKQFMHDEIERLKNDPSDVLRWMERHPEYAEAFDKHYGFGGIFKTKSVDHDTIGNEIDGEKPHAGRPSKAQKMTAFDALSAEDQALVETKVALVSKARKALHYKTTNTPELKERYAHLIELLRTESAELMVAAENPEVFNNLVNRYKDNRVVGDPRKSFEDSALSQKAYGIIKNLKGGHAM